MITKEEIISLLPYSKPFLFVDTIERIDGNSVTGKYRFRKDDFFYAGHFKNHPVTPGAVLTETMAQIGVVCLGIYLMKDNSFHTAFPGFAMVSSEAEYFAPVFPGETVTVTSEKIYFRFGKLKCNVRMQNSKGKVVCKGVIAGMITKRKDGK